MSQFNILARMATENKDINLSVNNFVGFRKVKAGAIAEIGVTYEVAMKLANQAIGGNKSYHCLLFVVDAEQYDQIREEIAAEEAKAKKDYPPDNGLDYIRQDKSNQY